MCVFSSKSHSEIWPEKEPALNGCEPTINNQKPMSRTVETTQNILQAVSAPEPRIISQRRRRMVGSVREHYPLDFADVLSDTADVRKKK